MGAHDIIGGLMTLGFLLGIPYLGWLALGGRPLCPLRRVLEWWAARRRH